MLRRLKTTLQLTGGALLATATALVLLISASGDAAGAPSLPCPAACLPACLPERQPAAQCHQARCASVPPARWLCWHGCAWQHEARSRQSCLRLAVGCWGVGWFWGHEEQPPTPGHVRAPCHARTHLLVHVTAQGASCPRSPPPGVGLLSWRRKHRWASSPAAVPTPAPCVQPQRAAEQP